PLTLNFKNLAIRKRNTDNLLITIDERLVVHKIHDEENKEELVIFPSESLGLGIGYKCGYLLKRRKVLVLPGLVDHIGVVAADSDIPSQPLPLLPSSIHLPPPVPTSLPLPSSPLPPLPALVFIPLPVDRREDILEAELPPHKRLCLTAPTSRYEVVKSSTAAPRPTRGHRVDYGFIGTLEAETKH
ncbi:hypothetical protein Tco_0746873, partial [Tanacetum coccineum]